jgi:hypothetical protein
MQAVTCSLPWRQNGIEENLNKAVVKENMDKKKYGTIYFSLA